MGAACYPDRISPSEGQAGLHLARAVRFHLQDAEGLTIGHTSERHSRHGSRVAQLRPEPFARTVLGEESWYGSPLSHVTVVISTHDWEQMLFERSPKCTWESAIVTPNVRRADMARRRLAVLAGRNDDSVTEVS